MKVGDGRELPEERNRTIVELVVKKISDSATKKRIVMVDETRTHFEEDACAATGRIFSKRAPGSPTCVLKQVGRDSIVRGAAVFLIFTAKNVGGVYGRQMYFGIIGSAIHGQRSIIGLSRPWVIEEAARDPERHSQ